MIEVQTGIEINNGDIIRLFFDWEDVLEHFNNRKSIVIS